MKNEYVSENAMNREPINFCNSGLYEVFALTYDRNTENKFYKVSI